MRPCLTVFGVLCDLQWVKQSSLSFKGRVGVGWGWGRGEGSNKQHDHRQTASANMRCHMTDAEMWLWQRLRSRQLAIYKFRRQHPYLDYVLDFVCLEKSLIVEVDGGQHLENQRDQTRDWCLHEARFRVLRFWNNQVLQETDAVVEAIWIALQNAAITPHPQPHPHPNLPPEGEGTVALSPSRGELERGWGDSALEGEGDCSLLPR